MEASETRGQEQFPPGWYDFHGGLRFWDGERWTEHIAPPPREETKEKGPMGFLETVLAVAIGALLAWGAIYLGPELAPDDIFVPIKFVGEEIGNLGGLGQ